MIIEQKIGTLVRVSNTQVQLVGLSIVKLGGQFKSLTGPTLLTSVTGIGGLDTGAIAASSLYYVYAVSTGSVEGLIASLNATSPAGFSRFKKVGLFQTDTSLNISDVYQASDNPTVAARAVQSSAQSIPNDANTTLIWDSVKTFDTHGALNSATGLFTAPESGYYTAKAGVLMASGAWTFTQRLHILLIKNNSVVAVGGRILPPTATALFNVALNQDVYLSKGETIGVQLFHNRGAATSIHNEATWNSFSIIKN